MVSLHCLKRRAIMGVSNVDFLSNFSTQSNFRFKYFL